MNKKDYLFLGFAVTIIIVSVILMLFGVGSDTVVVAFEQLGAIIGAILAGFWYLVRVFGQYKVDSTQQKEKHTETILGLTHAIDKLNSKIDNKFELMEEKLKHKQDK